ncbi:MAG: IS1634 family transposase [Candidatus Yonathbacteria bacterium]|nr:IS1634 family transposase [Candidatus Yonathbacteria bacterium]
MYVRTKTNPNSPRTAVQIVQSIRKGDRVVQKVVRHVGVAMGEKELAQLKLLAESMKVALATGPQESLWRPEELALRSAHRPPPTPPEDDADYRVNLKDIREEERTVRGIHEVYGALFDELRFPTIFASPTKATVRLFRDIVLARVANPKSKRGSVDLLEEDFGIALNLDLVYRMMDHLDDAAIGRLNDLTYRHTERLFPEKIDVLFFDCTTLYFESFTEDEFKRNGYSKDLKFSQPQVLLALMVTKEGLPVGYEAFPGDTYEGHTVIPLLTRLQERYAIDRVIFVADAAMFSRDNLAALEALDERHIEYIIGARLHNLPKALTAQMLDEANYREIGLGHRIGRFAYGGRTLLVSWTEARAKKDAHDRDRAIERTKKKLEKKKNPKEYLGNYGAKKYLTISPGATIALNAAKIEEDRRWDGLHGVITSAKGLLEKEIIAQYHQLWLVEESFRITKHDLKTRPIFHWKPERVRAHIAICYASYALVRYLEHRVKLQYARLSPEVIRQTLIRVQTSILYDRDKKLRYALPSRMSQDAKKIYQCMGIPSSAVPYILERRK